MVKILAIHLPINLLEMSARSFLKSYSSENCKPFTSKPLPYKSVASSHLIYRGYGMRCEAMSALEYRLLGHYYRPQLHNLVGNRFEKKLNNPHMKMSRHDNTTVAVPPYSCPPQRAYHCLVSLDLCVNRMDRSSFTFAFTGFLSFFNDAATLASSLAMQTVSDSNLSSSRIYFISNVIRIILGHDMGGMFSLLTRPKLVAKSQYSQYSFRWYNPRFKRRPDYDMHT